MIEILNRKDGKKLVYFTKSHYNEISEFLKSNKDSIVLFDALWILEKEGILPDNLDSILGLPINKLWIYGASIKNFDPIYKLIDLQELDLSKTVIKDFDFTNLSTLEEIDFIWNNKIKNFFLCENLSRIVITGYKSINHNLNEFSQFHKLVNLTINKSNIQILNGLEKLTQLKKLSLNYCKELNSSDFSFESIEELTINSCKNIDVNFFKSFPNLKKLTLSDQGNIQSVKNILDNLNLLKYISFEGNTRIIEKENEYFKDYTNITYFFFVDSKHNNLKCKELNKRTF